MKVGIYWPVIEPEKGGEFTLRNDVTVDLVNLVNETNHQLVIFTNDSQRLPLSIRQSERISLQTLPTKSGKTLEYALKATSRALRRLSTGSTLLKWHQRQILEQQLEQLIAEHQVQFFLFLSPQYLTLEIPYAVLIYDLQHRLQPFFPEVSAGGVWEMREEQFNHLLKRAAYVITGTETGRKEIQTFFQVWPDRIKVIPYPTPSFALREQANTSVCEEFLRKTGIDRPFFFYPAQFWPHKNHIGILHALKVLRDDESSLKPYVVFSGADKGNLGHIRRTVTELALDDQVKILGFIPLEEVCALYRTATALIFYSFFGPDNLPPLEAFALGCPVIAAKVPGAEEQLADAALLVDPTDYRALAATMRTLLLSPDVCSELKQKGRERSRQWTTTDFATSLFQLLDSFQPYRQCWL